MSPLLNWLILQEVSWMEEIIINVQTELKNQTAEGRGRLTDHTRTTLTDKGIVGPQAQGEEAQGCPKKWDYHENPKL